jgi:hypothetical protein
MCKSSYKVHLSEQVFDSLVARSLSLLVQVSFTKTLLHLQQIAKNSDPHHPLTFSQSMYAADIKVNLLQARFTSLKLSTCLFNIHPPEVQHL